MWIQLLCYVNKLSGTALFFERKKNEKLLSAVESAGFKDAFSFFSTKFCICNYNKQSTVGDKIITGKANAY